MLSEQDKYNIVYLATDVIPDAVWEIESWLDTYNAINRIMAENGYEIVKKEPTDAKD